jgi:hypothetical protein
VKYFVNKTPKNTTSFGENGVEGEEATAVAYLQRTVETGQREIGVAAFL